MFTIAQRDEFEDRGIVRLPGAIARADAEAMCNRVWRALEKRYGLRRESPVTWKGQSLLGTHHLPKSETFPEIGSPAIRSALDDLFGSGNWQPPERWGSLLATFPNSHDQWTVPHRAWHLDYPASSEMKELSIVRIFVCLAKLEPCSGGTVFVASSHRAIQNLVSKDGVARMRSADARTALIRTYDWMRSLCTLDESLNRVEAFMRKSFVADGVELRVVEMTGEPGDAFLTHPLLLHAGSKNAATHPRIALSSTVYRAGFKMAALLE
ncbi:MAG TPA: phytanoyl-CoA dioxygenase family protein [Candidatus Binataceae bacterium]|nr:phytanoyl-CoA dioxygenase family protein [Candidatus Binataceae bacterium]